MRGWRLLPPVWIGGSPVSHQRRLLAVLLLTGVLTGCSTGNSGQVAATATVPPLPSATTMPEATATDRPRPTVAPTVTAMPSATASDTPLPTSTNTPTATATATPTVFAVVRSQLRVNVRGGPGTDHDIVNILEPGSGVQILSENEEGDWYRVRLGDGERGWISARLLQVVNPPPTVPAPAVGTASASPTLEAVATEDQDEPIGAAPAADEALAIAEASRSQSQLLVNVPIVDLESINLTATVLVAAAASPVPGFAEAGAGRTAEPAEPAEPAAPSTDSVEVPTRLPAAPRIGVDVFAFCNNPVYGIGAPSNLTDGSTIEIFWAWFASTDAYLRQHIANATHELRINGTQIANVDQFRSAPRQRGRDQVVYWYVPYGPLEAGNYRITYRVTWRNAINDGYKSYGPGTGTEFEEESCNFVVR